MKMMKIVLFIGVSLLLMTSCEEFLNVTDPNRLTTDQFFKTEGDALMALTAAYAQLQVPLWGRWGSYECKFLVETYRTDEGNWSPDYNEWIEMYSFKMTAENYSSDYYWAYTWKGVYQTNLILENVPGIEMDATRKAQILGEAKFLRAFYYLKLVTYYRNIPLITSVPKQAEDYYPSQVQPAQIYAQIESDLKDAKEVLPVAWGNNDLGRATKGAATAYLGMTYLYQSDWAGAAAEFEEVRGLGYSLVPDYWDNFNGLNENNSESIFEIQFTLDRPNAVSESNTLVAQFSQWWQGWATDWLFNLFMTDTTATGELSERVYSSIVFDDPNSDVFYFYGDTYRGYFGPDENRPFWKKWVHKTPEWQAQEPSRQRSGINQVELRYADVLLMYAEVKNELGDIASAYQAVNQVRNRSGVPNLPVGMTQDQMRQQIRHYERPIELAIEGKRWADLVRWGDIKQTLTNHQHAYVNNFDTGVDEILPIPSVDINNNPNFVQNPGF